MQDLVDKTTKSVEKLDVDWNENNETQESAFKNIENAETELEKSPAELMDELLEFCFYKACKKGLKSTDLPMLSSTFFKNHVLPACPRDQSLDVKRSKYKKLSVFLKSMETKGIIVTSTKKGVQSILSINVLKNLHESEEDLEEEFQAPVITEFYEVTVDVLPIISKYDYGIGHILPRSEVERIFYDYVEKEGLQDESTFKPNGLLARLFRRNKSLAPMDIDEGLKKFFEKMMLMNEIKIGDSKILHPGKIEPINITVTSRSNMTRVTIVNNLETFGVHLGKFRDECKKIGAVASVANYHGQTRSVHVQGHHVLFVYKLLTEKYHIDKTYIRGVKKENPTKTAASNTIIIYNLVDSKEFNQHLLSNVLVIIKRSYVGFDDNWLTDVRRLGKVPGRRPVLLSLSSNHIKQATFKALIPRAKELNLRICENLPQNERILKSELRKNRRILST